MTESDPASPTPVRQLASPLRRGVFVLPNLITSAALFSGFYSIICCFRGDFLWAGIAILIANVFDALDGRIARLTRATTRFGIEYDSLSDVIAFGVAPGILVYRWALEPWGTWGWLAASLYVTCGALRLARFNVQFDNAEKRHFIGLPTPAAAEVIASTVLLYNRFGGEGETHKHLILLLVTYALAGLMVSNVRYPSFKESDLYRRRPFSFLVAAIVVLKLIIAEPQVMLFAGFWLYAASGPVRSLVVRLKRVRSLRRRHRTASLSSPDRPPPAADPAGEPDTAPVSGSSALR